MLSKTRGILLHTVKYGDKSLIVTLYTEKSGRQSYMVNDTRGPHAKNKSSMMQPLFLLELEAYTRESRALNRIREVWLYESYQSIPFDVVKSGQAIFLAEILYKILLEEEANPPFFQFMENSLRMFDAMQEGSSSFHIWFLARLTGWMGILPHLEETASGWFDMKRGVSVVQEPLHPYSIDPDISLLLKKLLQVNIGDLPTLSINHKQRNQLLIKLMDYFHIHFESLGQVKSVAVLKEVFE
jgi:DNA repair protein RecO (recombination protein O)